jgi:hypothetical protein
MNYYTYLFFYYDGEEKTFKVKAASMWHGNYELSKITKARAWKVRRAQ